MRRLGWMMVLAWLAGCDGAHDPSDGSMPEGDAGPPAFEVRLERSIGVAIDDGEDLEVEYGCQGGAHVVFDVVAIGAGLDDAQVTVSALGREPITFTMTGTPTGAEFRYLMFILADFAAGGLGLPREDFVHVSVRRRDGARVVLDRAVRFVDGDVCSMTCQYVDIAGTARITAIDGPTTTGCEAGDVTLGYDFTPQGATESDPGHTHTDVLPFDCLAAMGLAVGADVPAMRRDLLPGTGSCTPFDYALLLDRDACAAACPAP